MDCIVCGNRVFDELYNGLLIKCNSCGYIRAKEDLDDALLQKIYSGKYFQGEEYLDYSGDKEIHLKNFSVRLKKIFKTVEKEKLMSVFEIGCAYGFFGEALRAALPGCNYTGMDISGDAVEYGKSVLKLDVIQGDYLDHQTNEKYSAIFMWDVIEHLKFPEKYLDKIYSDLDHGGRLYLTTGDIDRFVPKIQKSRWRLIHPPSHLHYFSARTMKLLLQKKGFKIISITYPPVYRSFRQIFYSVFILNKKSNKIKNFVYRRIPKKLFIPLNTFDIMMVVTQKKSI